MVEYTLELDDIFSSLADPIRRDILERVRDIELSVSEIAHIYDVSLAAVSKHLNILHSANLIKKRRQGKFTMVRTRTQQLEQAEEYLRKFTVVQQQRYNTLESLVEEK